MTNKEKYKQAFSVLHASEHISLEVNKKMGRTKVFRPAKKLVVTCACAAAVMGTGITGYAAYHLLPAQQVASEMYGKAFMKGAFEGENGILMNESIESDGYIFTLLGLSSGSGLMEYLDDNQKQMDRDETYAVVAVEHADGTPMPNTSDENYDMSKFLITPFIGGEEPWKVNIYGLDGGYTEITRDGVAYRMISCKNLTPFADRGVYLGICNGLSDIQQAYYLDEKSGEIKKNESFDGVSVLYQLPIDISKADQGKAEQILDQIENPVEEDDATSVDIPMAADLAEWYRWLEMDISYSDIISRCHVVEGSEKTVSADKDGVFNYYFGDEGDSLCETINIQNVDLSGDFHVLGWDSSDTVESLNIVLYAYNEDGTVTFETLTPTVK